jgi:hypothetical protein
MSSRSLFLISILLVVMFVGTTSATISVTDYNTRITIADQTATLSQVYDAVVTAKGEDASDAMVDHGSGVYEVKYQVYFYDNGILQLRDNELRVGFYSSSARSLWGRLDSNNSRIVGWDSTGGTAKTDLSGSLPTYRFTTGTNIRNTELNYNSLIWVGYSSTTSYCNDTVIQNVTNQYAKTGMQFFGYNISVDGLTIRDIDHSTRTSRYGISLSKVWNSSIKNVNVINISEFTGLEGDDSTGSYGIQFDGGDNNTFENLYVDGCAYSGYNLQSDYSTYINLTATNTHHNAVEFQVDNSILDGLTIDNNTIHGLFISRSVGGSNVTISNVTVSDTGTGYSIRLLGENAPLVGYNFSNVFADTGILSSATEDSNFINVTAPSIEFDYSTSDSSILSNNNNVINSDIATCTLQKAHDIRILNNNTNVIEDITPCNYSVLYPINVKVQNTTASPVSNAEITVTTTGLSLNGYGVETLTAYTDADGKLNESQQLYVADFLRDSSAGYTYYTVDIQASKDGETDSELAINPDSSWLSPDLSDLQGPLQTLTLNVAGTDEPGVEYFTGDTSKTYLNYPVKYTWSAGTFTISFPNDGTLTEAPEEITGVEVHP